MKHPAYKPFFAIVAAAIAVQACDSPSDPLPVDPPAPVYDLLYESFVSATVLQQSLSGEQPKAPLAGVGSGIDPTSTLNGRYVAYAVRNATNFSTVLHVADRVLGTITPIVDDGLLVQQPTFSPDGSKIAYTASDGSISDIWVVNRDGTGRVKLTTDPLPGVVFDHAPAWSPDGNRIAWSNNQNGFLQSWVMNSDGSNKHRITATTDAFEDDVAWSHDGTRIVFFEVVNTTPNLVIVNADGTNRRVLATAPGGVNRHPVWSPDGLLIAFTNIPPDQSRPQIYTMKVDGTDVQRRTHDSLNRGGHHAAFIRR